MSSHIPRTRPSLKERRSDTIPSEKRGEAGTDRAGEPQSESARRAQCRGPGSPLHFTGKEGPGLRKRRPAAGGQRAHLGNRVLFQAPRPSGVLCLARAGSAASRGGSHRRPGRAHPLRCLGRPWSAPAVASRGQRDREMMTRPQGSLGKRLGNSQHLHKGAIRDVIFNREDLSACRNF